MNTITFSLLRALPRQVPSTSASSGPLTFIRAESSSRRLTKKLRLPPHHSMIANSTSPAQTHITHNPPSTSPNVYATPNLFLPKDDPRRSYFLGDVGCKRKNDKLPPPLKKPYEKKYHLTPDDFAEIRRLRTEDPNVWTRRKLAEKFNTSSLFIGMICEATEARKAVMQGRLAVIKGRWGSRKTKARMERKRRRSGWGGADGM